MTLRSVVTFSFSFALIVALWPFTVAAQDTTYTPAHELESGTELVAVYIGANSCGPCKLPKVKEAVASMKQLLDGRASRRGWSFTAMGVSLDWDVETGYNFLRRNGPWDEVVIGNSWTNLGASRFIWSDSTAQPAMPQLVILKREVSVDGRIDISSSQVLARHTGGEKIPQWVDRGAPLPQ